MATKRGHHFLRARRLLETSAPFISLFIFPLIYKGMFYKFVLMEILYLGLTWLIYRTPINPCCFKALSNSTLMASQSFLV